jgi:hypothetical protein
MVAQERENYQKEKYEVHQLFSVARGDLVDPLMHEQVRALKKPEVLGFIHDLIKDQREYLRLLSSGKFTPSAGTNVEVFIRNKGRDE